VTLPSEACPCSAAFPGVEQLKSARKFVTAALNRMLCSPVYSTPDFVTPVEQTGSQLPDAFKTPAAISPNRAKRPRKENGAPCTPLVALFAEPRIATAVLRPHTDQRRCWESVQTLETRESPAAAKPARAIQQAHPASKNQVTPTKSSRRARHACLACAGAVATGLVLRQVAQVAACGSRAFQGTRCACANGDLDVCITVGLQ
jgi:hypothetical protein